jgi:hypothetical protein
MEIRGKGKPIFCGSGGEWKVELEQRLQKDAEIVLLALGDVKYEVLAYLNRRAQSFITPILKYLLLPRACAKDDCAHFYGESIKFR